MLKIGLKARSPSLFLLRNRKHILNGFYFLMQTLIRLSQHVRGQVNLGTYPPSDQLLIKHIPSICQRAGYKAAHQVCFSTQSSNSITVFSSLMQTLVRLR